jgi:hypothetical protein
MATGSVETLQAEIRQLEQDLARRRRALEILQQGMGKPTAAPALRPAATAGAQPPTTRSVLEKLFTAAPNLRLTSKQIRERLQQRRLLVTPKTIQRQLSALVKAKVIRVQNGRYGLVPKSPAKLTTAVSKTMPKPGPTTAAAAKSTPATKTPQRSAGAVAKAIK